MRTLKNGRMAGAGCVGWPRPHIKDNIFSGLGGFLFVQPRRAAEMTVRGPSVFCVLLVCGRASLKSSASRPRDRNDDHEIPMDQIMASNEEVSCLFLDLSVSFYLFVTVGGIC